MTAHTRILRASQTMLSRNRILAYAAPMDTAPDDSALMLRYCDGDVAAFEVLYRRHNDALYRYLLRLCHGRGRLPGSMEQDRPRAGQLPTHSQVHDISLPRGA